MLVDVPFWSFSAFAHLKLCMERREARGESGSFELEAYSMYELEEPVRRSLPVRPVVQH